MDKNEIRLHILRRLYQERARGIFGRKFYESIPVSEEEYTDEALYLHEEGLINAHKSDEIGFPEYVIKARITSLGVRQVEGNEKFQIVKLHPDTIDELRAILLSAIDKAGLPKDDAKAWKKLIENASAAALARFASEGISHIVKEIPVLWIQLRNILQENLHL